MLESEVWTYVHESVGHWSNHSNATRLLQRKSLLVVFQEHDGLLVKVSGQLLGCSIVNQASPFAFGGSRIRVLKETHLELDAEQSGHSGVDSRNIQLARLDQLGDLLEVAVRMSA